MNKKKILSLIMALVMLVGVFSPLTALAAANDGSVVFKITTKVDHDNDTKTPEVLAGSLSAEGKTAATSKTETSITFNTDSTKTLNQNNVLEPTVKPVAGYRFVKWDKPVETNIRPNTGETIYTAVFEKIGTSTPSTAEKTETVTLHKILLSEEGFTEGKFPGQIGLNSEKYVGNKVDQKQYFGRSAEEADGVYFALKFAPDYGTTDAEKQMAGKYVKADANDKLKPANPLAATDKVDEAVGGITANKSGIVFKTSDLKGKFEIDEIVEKSNYKNGAKVLTGSKAVPVEITLPLVNENGVVENAHVYPKNTDNAPKLDKNFSLEEAKKSMSAADAQKLLSAVEHKKAFDKAEKAYSIESDEYKAAKKAYTDDEKALIKKWGIDFSKPDREGKAQIDRKVGDLVEYTVETEIPAQTKWGSAKWDDKMTDGLTFVTKEMAKAGTKYDNKSIVVKYNGTVMDEKWYTLNEDNNGFVLNLTKDGLDGINGKAKEATITLTYSAEVNKESITDMPDSNDVTFHYGNKPNQGTTPIPTKPNKDGDLTINKTWDDGKWADGESATFKLVDANTGKDVTVNDVNSVNGYKFEGTVTLKKGDTATYTWKGLKTDRQYKAVEISSTSGSEAEYVKQADGSIKVVNHRSDNPEPLNPSEPKVITGGKRFVKTNQDGTKRLAGAEFLVTRKFDKDGNLIKNDEKTAVAKTQYLALKSGDTTAKEVTNYENAENAYKGFVAEFNKIVAKADAENKNVNYPVTISGQTYSNKEAVDKKLNELKDDRDKKFLAARQNYKWIDAKDAEAAQKAGALVLTSDDQGRLEINGIAYGDYQLVEIKAPDGFAKLSEEVKFTVAEGTYKGNKKEFKYTEEIKAAEGQELTDEQKAENKKNADIFGQQIVNKKVTIPQTGGIGTVIFTVVGISLMAGAVMAMKKNREEA